MNEKIWLTIGWLVIFIFVVTRKRLFTSPSWLEKTELAEAVDGEGNFLPGMKTFFIVWAIFLLTCMWFNLGAAITIGGFIVLMICQKIYTTMHDQEV